MLFIHPDRPINTHTWQIIAALKTVSEKTGYDYFLVGATARDILMEHCFNLRSSRATRDVDFAIAINSWDALEEVKKALVDTGNFSASDRSAHRLHYRSEELEQGYPLDLIPFGGIESVQHKIAWPPDMMIVMNVAGYSDALKAVEQVDLGNGLIANIISLPALAAIKLVAWVDRGRNDNRDALDLCFLLRNYEFAGIQDRLYDEAYDILEKNQFDSKLAGATLLGQDARLVLSNTTTGYLLGILNDMNKIDHLVIDMDRDDPESASKLIALFREGLQLPI